MVKEHMTKRPGEAFEAVAPAHHGVEAGWRHPSAEARGHRGYGAPIGAPRGEVPARCVVVAPAWKRLATHPPLPGSARSGSLAWPHGVLADAPAMVLR